ncbi:MAG: alpha/beta hydrolase [Myxococcota bacterium]
MIRLVVVVLISGCATVRHAEPLVLGETFTLESRVLREPRRINVYRPPAAEDGKLPVLFVLDGGAQEDFPHLAGLVQVLVANGGMRPFLVVGIENTQRRRDLTGPTDVAADRAIAPVVGGSAQFRAFLRDELLPEVARRYQTTGETALVGESLAGLFVVETFFLEPALFDTYVAVEPSLGWNGRALINSAPAKLAAWPQLERTLFLAGANAEGNGALVGELAKVLETSAPPRVHWTHAPFPEESHGTVFHPAALRAFRTVFTSTPR